MPFNLSPSPLEAAAPGLQVAFVGDAARRRVRRARMHAAALAVGVLVRSMSVTLLFVALLAWHGLAAAQPVDAQDCQDAAEKLKRRAGDLADAAEALIEANSDLQRDAEPLGQQLLRFVVPPAWRAAEPRVAGQGLRLPLARAGH